MIEPQAPQERHPSLGSRVAGVFLSPGRTFAAIAARPDWLAPMLIGGIVAGLLGYALYKPIIVPMQLERIESRADVPPEHVQQAEERFNSPVASVVAGVLPVLFIPIIILLQAAVLLFVGSLIMGGQAPFKAVLSVTAYAALVYALGSLLQAPVHLWATHSMDSVAGLGFMIPSDAGAGMRFVRGVLASIDLFLLWQTALLAIGVSKVYRKPLSFGVTCAAVLWVIGALIGGIGSVLGGPRT